MLPDRLLSPGSPLVAWWANPTTSRHPCRPSPCRRRLSRLYRRCLCCPPFCRFRPLFRCPSPHHLMPPSRLPSPGPPMVAWSSIPTPCAVRAPALLQPFRRRLSRPYRRCFCRQPFRRSRQRFRCQSPHHLMPPSRLPSPGPPMVAWSSIPTPCHRLSCSSSRIRRLSRRYHRRLRRYPLRYRCAQPRCRPPHHLVPPCRPSSLGSPLVAWLAPTTPSRSPSRYSSYLHRLCCRRLRHRWHHLF